MLNRLCVTRECDGRTERQTDSYYLSEKIRAN